jgi:hypothetical protein
VWFFWVTILACGHRRDMYPSSRHNSFLERGNSHSMLAHKGSWTAGLMIRICQNNYGTQPKSSNRKTTNLLHLASRACDQTNQAFPGFLLFFMQPETLVQWNCLSSGTRESEVPH